MCAAFIDTKGEASQIQVGELPTPDYGPNDVLVRVEYSAVNNVDLFVRSGAWEAHTPFPFVIGRNVVGIVEAVGEGVCEFSPGDAVWSNSAGYDGRQGAFTELVSLPQERVFARATQDVSGKEIPAQTYAALSRAFSTAHLGISRLGGFTPGSTVFIGGVAGGAGSTLAQYAVASGVRVIGSASPRDFDWVHSLGVDEVLDYHRNDLADALAQVAPEGFDIWWDNSGTNDFSLALPLMAFGGKIALLSGMNSDISFPAGALYTRDLQVRGFAMPGATADDLADTVSTLNKFLGWGNLQVRIGEIFDLADARTAHEAQEAGSLRGKIAVKI